MKLSLGQKIMNCKQKVSNAVSRIRAKQPQELANNILERMRPKDNKQRVEFVVQEGSVVDSKIAGALVEKMADLEALAESNRVNVKITQYGKNLAINSGAVTSYVNTANIESAKNLYNAVEDNIISNRKSSTTLSHRFNIY